MPVSSPTHGIIEEILAADGATVKSGQPLFKVKVTEAGAAPPAASKPSGAPAPAPPPPTPSGRILFQLFSKCVFVYNVKIKLIFTSQYIYCNVK